MPSRHRWTALLGRVVCVTVVLTWLLFVWRLWNQGDERWITALVGGPTGLFVALVGFALVGEAWASDRWRGVVIVLVLFVAIVVPMLR